MSELFKNIYNETFFSRFTTSITAVIPDFDSKYFLKEVYNNEWESKELKQRMRHITHVLKNNLTNDFKDNVEIILKLIPALEKNGFKPNNLEFIFFPDFIEIYGIDDFDTSVNAFEVITQFVSCEFAVRPFIIHYPKTMLQQMLDWSNHKQSMVRRLATEGCRPRLPWAMAIPFLKENPEPIIPILENLKNDVSENVRRSVANNLNDISKDNPTIVIYLVKKWKNTTKESVSLTKHACRTLLKQGNLEVMELFGFGDIDKIKITDFKITTPIVSIGGALEFLFNIENINNTASKIRLEYGLYYQKANSSLSKKVFKISEKEYSGNSTTIVRRKQSFKVITTRKFHIGKHQLSIIINGVEFEKIDFELTA
ncbi:DNA alkylation repair protein [Tenacibaculum sp. Bg11-29]|uniref:DNA alkylation repair protein n=1 Tax=Tenacibaculum sp. Bg11-29 TaxID=2058306 RepID=UPI000C345BDD|nr:DNA alkylation repair protein [Tenacibaculum sp. Bg11-29]PKH49386.1 DNA alkylation repair protein [Tenacibaculum sp. Bg11-29]